MCYMCGVECVSSGMYLMLHAVLPVWRGTYFELCEVEHILFCAMYMKWDIPCVALCGWSETYLVCVTCVEWNVPCVLLSVWSGMYFELC